MRRTERLFAMAEYLRGRRTGITAAALAERFGVTLRTVYRDLDSLRLASLPINAERGRGGGYALERTYSLPPVNFTPREAAVLIAACGFLGEMRVIPFIDTVASALDKVRAALNASSQRQLLTQLETLRFVGVPAHAIPPKVRAAVERAWFDGAVLAMRYQGSKGPTTRRVRIKSVIMERSETLLNCDDLEKNEPRQFKLDRIEWAEVEGLSRPRI
jgi:predicted DNA-binding transcriptional regulator YafY